MVMSDIRRWTADEVRSLTREDQPWPRYELIGGELLVTPVPRMAHQVAAFEICRLLDAYLKRNPAGVAVMSPADLELASGTTTQPDVFVIPAGVHASGATLQWSDVSSLLLAVEILSPSSEHTDRVIKRDFYLANQVSEYWVVDLDARVVERWTGPGRAAEVLHGTLRWAPRESDALVIDLPEFFETVESKCLGW
jgi:Uma2 family endonuclease